MRCTVTATLQHGESAPVSVRWATDSTPVQALLAVAQLLDHEDTGDSQPGHPTLLKIEVTVR